MPLKRLINNVKHYTHDSNMKYDDRKNLDSVHERLSLRESLLVYFIGVINVPVSLYLVISYNMSFHVFRTNIINSYSGVFNRTLENVNYYISTR